MHFASQVDQSARSGEQAMDADVRVWALSKTMRHQHTTPADTPDPPMHLVVDLCRNRVALIANPSAAADAADLLNQPLYSDTFPGPRLEAG